MRCQPTDNTRLKFMALSLLISALTAGPTLALAQSDMVLEEVVVMAQKREQSLQDVPIAVSALSSNQLLEAGITDMSGVSHQVPTLEVQTNVTAVSTSFRIRRVGNIGNIPTFEPAVGVFLDGAFRLRSFFGASELFDIERIEVLRGPQSTLYGKNTTAGVVGIYTALPSYEFDWKAEVTGGAYDSNGSAGLFNFRGGFGGPLSDTLRGSLGMSYANNGDILIQDLAVGGEDANDLNRFSLRGQFVWEPSDALSFRLIAGTVQEDDKTTTPDIYYDPDGYLPTLLATLQADGISVPCFDNDPTNRISCFRVANTSDVKSYEVTLIGEYALANGWTVTSITGWDWFKSRAESNDAAQVSAPLVQFHDTQEGESWQQELRLTSAGGESVDWLAGVFLYSNDFHRGDKGKKPTFLHDTDSSNPALIPANLAAIGLPLLFATPGQNGYLDARQRTDYIGIFGQATWNVSDSFSITGGLRWQEEKKDASLKQWVNVPGFSIFSLALSPANISGDFYRKSDDVTWSITPQWFVTDNTMLYATIAHGFKSGGFNVGFGRIALDDREFGDEDVMNYEAGIKTELLEGRMSLAASAFYTDYKNYQDAAFIGAQFTVGNAEKAELKGVELDTTVLLNENFTLDVNISYADFTYAENTSGPCYPGRTPDSPTTPGACVLSGDHPVNAPEWKTHMGLQYDRPVDWGDVYVRGDWSWTDDYNTSFSADPRLVQNAYSWLNLRAGARWKNYELVAWIDNILDTTVTNYDLVLNIYTGDNSFQSYLQAPRSWGLTFRVNY